MTGPARRQRRDASTALLLSYRQGDALLRARNGTVAALVARNVIRAVPWLDGQRVPRTEIERLASEGLPRPAARPPRIRRRAAVGTCDPAALRALRVEDL